MTNSSGFWLADLYAGRIAYAGHWVQLAPGWLSLAWQHQPNGHRCFLTQDRLRDPGFQAHEFDGCSLKDVLAAGHASVGAELTADERRATQLVRFGRVGRALALRLPECPARVFDDLDDLEMAHG
jgi:hypothetical protein